jgi:hypothetical protein
MPFIYLQGQEDSKPKKVFKCRQLEQIRKVKKIPRKHPG